MIKEFTKVHFKPDSCRTNARMNKDINRKFIKAFLSVVIFIVLVTSAIHGYMTDVLTDKISYREKNLISKEKEFIETILYTYLSDVIFLARITENHLGNEKKNIQRELLKDEYKEFSKAREVYEQARFIDISGMELVRVNNNKDGLKIVADDNLQNKGNRYYFKKGLRPKNELYISKFDLNMEQGKVEVPYKPMLRFSTTVYNNAGQPKGVIVLNYLGISIIDRLKGSANSVPETDLFMVNSDGYWIVGPTPSDEWGFMFKEHEDKTIESLYKNEWQKISTATKGQFTSPKGLFTFQTVYPMGTSVKYKQKSHKGEAEENWKIISVVSVDNLRPPWIKMLYGISFFLIAIIGLIMWLLIKARLKEQEHINTLEHQENTFRNVTNAVRDAIIMMDSDGTIVFWNEAATELFGYKTNEAMNKELHSLIVPRAMQDKAREGVKRFKEKGKGNIFGKLIELDAKRKNGSEIPVEISVSSLHIEDEKYSVGTVRDITDRRRIKEQIIDLNRELEQRVTKRTEELEKANQDLLESDEKLRSITKAALSAIIMMDNNGKITFWNKAAEDIFGWSNNEAIGNNLHELIVPEQYNEVFQKAFPHFAKTGHGAAVGKKLELSALHKDGKEISVEVSISAIKLRGQWTAVGIVNDITERKQVEKDLKDNLDDLERFTRLAINREDRMIELKQEINELLKQLGQKEKYKIVP